MRIVFAIAALAVLASCGADGPPRPPAPKPATGLSISGQVQIGVSG